MDQDTKAVTQVSVNIFKQYDGVEIVREIMKAALQAAGSLGFINAEDFETDIKVHTILRRKL